MGVSSPEQVRLRSSTKEHALLNTHHDAWDIVESYGNFRLLAHSKGIDEIDYGSERNIFRTSEDSLPLVQGI